MRIPKKRSLPYLISLEEDIEFDWVIIEEE